MLATIPNCLFYFIIIIFLDFIDNIQEKNNSYSYYSKNNPVIPKTWRQSQYVQVRKRQRWFVPLTHQ